MLPLSEAVHHPHLVARAVYVDRGGGPEPAPAPRFSRTEATLVLAAARPAPAQHTREALAAWGIDDVESLLESGAAFQA